MKHDEFESILDESVSAVQAGIPMDEVLAEVPEYAAELRPLLYAARMLTDPNPGLAPDAAKAALREKYIAQVTDLPAVPHLPLIPRVQTTWRIIRRRLTLKVIVTDVIAVLLTMLLTALMLAFSVAYWASDTIPSDWLYGVKRISESVQLTLTFSQAQRDTLAETFNQRRLDEIQRLMAANQAAVVTFEGTLETRNQNLWVVAGLTVFIPAHATIANNPQPGDTIEFTGILRANQVLEADSVRVLERNTTP